MNMMSSPSKIVTKNRKAFISSRVPPEIMGFEHVANSIELYEPNGDGGTGSGTNPLKAHGMAKYVQSTIVTKNRLACDRYLNGVKVGCVFPRIISSQFRSQETTTIGKLHPTLLPSKYSKNISAMNGANIVNFYSKLYFSFSIVGLLFGRPHCF